MNLLVFDDEGTGLGLAMKAQRAGHEVAYHLPPALGKLIGRGLVRQVEDWKHWADWADVIFVCGNSNYRAEVAWMMDRGLPVLGSNTAGAMLEHDRALGQEVLEGAGVGIVPFETFDSMDKAIAYVKKEDRGFAIKPWGGATDKALSYVAKTPQEAIFILEDWKSRKLKGELMLQTLIPGIEMGVACWFGPGGWNRAIEENWEFKKLMDGDLGCNTGEQGTVMRFVQRSKLFRQVLEPLGDYLHRIDYVGNVDVNCMIDPAGRPWPLELATRAGWPAFNLQLALFDRDPVEWMLELLEGKDEQEMKTEVCVGLVLTHGDYPAKTPPERAQGRPLWGTASQIDSLYFQQMMLGVGLDSELKPTAMPVTAGDYALVATGMGASVGDARRAAYAAIRRLESPTNLMYRTDIGERLKRQLPELQSHGYATGMEY